MDLREQLKNLFPDHIEQDFELPQEKFEQKTPLICKYEKKGRNGKLVTLIEGGVIIIQGDNRDKIMKILQDLGYNTKRVGG